MKNIETKFGMDGMAVSCVEDSNVDRNTRLGAWLTANADREGMKRFYVDGKLLYSPWIKGWGYKFLARHLIDPVRVVLGLWGQNPHRISIKNKAAMAGINPGEYIALNRILYESDIAAVRFCKAYGLPASASVDLSGQTITCEGCQSTLGSLPCIYCWCGVEDDPTIDQPDKTPCELRLKSGRATSHPPGSPGKVEVLRRRLERGENLWHPDDRKGFDSVINELSGILGS